MRFRRKKSYIDNGVSIIDVDNLLKDTTRTERFQVFDVLASKRKYLVALLLISGTLSATLSLQFFVGAQTSFLTLTAMVFIGVSNLVGGLLLLSSE